MLVWCVVIYVCACVHACVCACVCVYVLVWCVVVWCGMAGVVWHGVVWHGVVWQVLYGKQWRTVRVFPGYSPSGDIYIFRFFEKLYKVL